MVFSNGLDCLSQQRVFGSAPVLAFALLVQSCHLESGGSEEK
jgi:hypothetical protein